MINGRILKKFEEIAYGLLNKRGDMRTFHVAFLLKKGRIHTIAHNDRKTHPKIKTLPYPELSGLHAELSCFIKGGLEDYSDFKMAVCRIDKNQKLNMSKPCFACATAAKQLSVSQVYYTNSDGDWEFMNPLTDNVEDRRGRFLKN